MSGNVGNRLRRLGLVYRRPAPPTDPEPGFDPSRLSLEEGDELDQLLALVAAAGRGRPGRRWDFAALGDDRLERLVDLDQKARGPAAALAAEADPGGSAAGAGRVPGRKEGGR